MSYLQLAKDMYAMTGQGQMLEAFEKYYHEDANIFAEPQSNFTHKLKLNALALLSLAFETPVLDNPDFFASS